MNVAGQDFVQLEFEPRSDMAKVGMFRNGEVGYFFESTASCQLVMSQN